MQITTMHTLVFSMKALGNEQHTTAINLIRLGAKTLDVQADIMSDSLKEGEDTLSRASNVHVRSEDHDKLELYWAQVSGALAFIGVEATSP